MDRREMLKESFQSLKESLPGMLRLASPLALLLRAGATIASQAQKRSACADAPQTPEPTSDESRGRE